MFNLVEETTSLEQDAAVIKVIGVGGGGSNALDYMIANHIENVEFICVNTDSQALESSNAEKKLRLGRSMTNGLGAGCNPEVGREAAMEDRDKLQDILGGADMVFIAAGMGGGTGTGAVPIISEIARANGSLTIAVVTKPFMVEGSKRTRIALEGIEELKRNVDSLITIPNEKLISVLGEVTLLEAFDEANKVLYGAVQGIAELITCRGLVNLDFADVKTIMSGTGMAMIGTGRAEGENRAYEAAHAAISNPLLDDVDLSNAGGLLVNITSGKDMTLSDYQEIGTCMSELTSADANMAIGTVIDDNMENQIRVTLVATGFGDSAIVEQDQEQTSEDDLSEPVTVQLRSSLSSTDGSGDIYDQPAIDRKPVPEFVDEDDPGQGVSNKEYQENLLDIPAFLRQQVD